MTTYLEGKLGHLDRTAKVFLSLKVTTESATYIEIGAHRGRSIVAIGNLLKDKVKKLHIIGYDLFGGDTQLHIAEDNGKGAGNIIKCSRQLSKLCKRNPHVTYELKEGYTTDTLTPSKATWAYIDGGHSYDTVKWDHQQLKDCDVIVFDDTDLEGVNKYLWEIKDQYKLYELYSDPGGSKQVAIINNVANYNFDTAELTEFKGSDPETYRGYR
jgi:hypothetical protein